MDSWWKDLYKRTRETGSVIALQAETVGRGQRLRIVLATSPTDARTIVMSIQEFLSMTAEVSGYIAAQDAVEDAEREASESADAAYRKHIKDYLESHTYST